MMRVMLNEIAEVKEFTSLMNKNVPEDVEITLKSGKHVVDGKSILGIFSLDLSRPVELEVHSANPSDSVSVYKLVDKFLVI